MKAQNNNSGNQLQETQKKSSSRKEGFEMKMASKIQSVMVNLLNGMKITVPAKLLGGLALGAILMTAVALPSGNAQASPLFAGPVAEVLVDTEDEGGITDFEEAYTSEVNVVSDLGGGITDFEEAYTSVVKLASDLGGGITDFEEAYTSKVSLLHPENEQANIFPEVEL